MSTCLKIGNRLFDGEQIISALVRYKILDVLVEQVLLDEVIQDISLSKQELFHAITGATNAPIPEDFGGFLIQWCQRQGITPTYLHTVMLRELRVKKFKQLYFANQVESEFLRAKSDFDQVEYSLIQLTDLPLAQELYFQLRDDGADFSQLAKQYSLGSERHSGGWMGPVPLSTLPADITSLFRSGQPGTVYGPIPVADRFWLIRLERLTTARLTETLRRNLIEQLCTRWLQSQVETLMATPGTIAVQLNPPNQSVKSSSE